MRTSRSFKRLDGEKNALAPDSLVTLSAFERYPYSFSGRIIATFDLKIKYGTGAKPLHLHWPL
jgi:hypothetical protein